MNEREDLKEMFKEVTQSVPWQFKVLWSLGALLSLGFFSLLIWLVVVLIRHFS